MEFIDLKSQYRRYQPETDERIRRVLRHGQYVMGPEVAEVEEALATYVGVKHCIAVSSGTHSLEIALRALEIGPGDEVITVLLPGSARRKSSALLGRGRCLSILNPPHTISTWICSRPLSPSGTKRLSR